MQQLTQALRAHRSLRSMVQLGGESAGRPRLWCVPFAGGGPARWRPWSTGCAGVAEVVGFCPPGRENRYGETPLTRTSELAHVLADEVAAAGDGHYALCGHSVGALIAFEAAHELRRRNMPAPQALVVCAMRAPHMPRTEPTLHTLGQRDFVNAVEARFGAIPSELRQHPDFVDLLLPPLRADLEAYERYNYIPRDPLDCPILALGGLSDPIIRPPEVLAWERHTTARFEAAFLPLGHFFPQDDPAATIDHVRRFLSRAM